MIRFKRFAALTLAVLILASFAGCDNDKYKKAGDLYDAGDYEAAKEIYIELGDYRHSEEHLAECEEMLQNAQREEIYVQAKELFDSEEYLASAELLTTIRDYSDANAMLSDIADMIAGDNDIETAWQLYNDHGERGAIARLNVPLAVGESFGAEYVIGVEKSGKIVSIGFDEETTAMLDTLNLVRKVACGSDFAVILLNNGTLCTANMAGSSISQKEEELLGLKDVTDIDCGGLDVVAVSKKDGSVVAFDGYTRSLLNIDFDSWKDIVCVCAGKGSYIGLTRDGYVDATGQNDSGQLDITLWGNVISLDAGSNHTVALKGDGTVVTSGKDDQGQCQTSGWKDIVAISAAGSRTVGLCGDGTVVCCGDIDPASIEIMNGWKDVRFVLATENYVYAIDASGRVLRSDDAFTIPEGTEAAGVAAWDLF